MGTSLDTMVPPADGSLMPRIALPCAGSAVRRSLCRSSRHEQPFRHWRLREVLPTGLCAALTALPFAPPEIDDTLGKRDTHNALRVFIDEPTRTRFPACAVLAETFQDEATTALLSDLTGRDLDGSFLRIEYCLDTAGFWLEPHTDIGAKLFTLLIYLSDHPDAENWGTDLMDKQGNVLGRSSGAFNTGFMFIPADDTWHGFTPRAIRGVRRSLIVNYVKPEWRARHELAFPDQVVTGVL